MRRCCPETDATLLLLLTPSGRRQHPPLFLGPRNLLSFPTHALVIKTEVVECSSPPKVVPMLIAEKLSFISSINI